jgi:hypothetical protein
MGRVWGEDIDFGGSDAATAEFTHLEARAHVQGRGRFCQ